MARKPKVTVPPAVYPSRLALRQVRLAVRLGYEKEERKTVQLVDIDLTFYFPTLPEGAKDDHGAFLCYDKISHLIHDACQAKEFRLIEYLGMQIYRTVRAAASPEIKLCVTATKCSLPVSFVHGGASFCYSDLPPFSWVAPV